MSESRTHADAARPAEATPPRPDPFSRSELRPVPVRLTVRLADGSHLVGDLLQLAPGDLLHLDTPVGEPSQLLAEGTVIASGELVEIKGHLEFRVTSVGRTAHD